MRIDLQAPKRSLFLPMCVKSASVCIGVHLWLHFFCLIKANLAATKLRPALVFATHGEDIIVMGIFSRLPPVPGAPFPIGG
jgi:hypothetical protein